MGSREAWNQALVLIILSVFLIPVHVIALLRIRAEARALKKQRSDLLTVVKFTQRRRR